MFSLYDSLRCNFYHNSFSQILHCPVLTGQDRSKIDQKEIQTSVIDVINNLPEENLSILAKKLENILSHTGQFCSRQKRHV